MTSSLDSAHKTKIADAGAKVQDHPIYNRLHETTTYTTPKVSPVNRNSCAVYDPKLKLTFQNKKRVEAAVHTSNTVFSCDDGE